MPACLAALISCEEAVSRMSGWMQGHPIMSAAAEREIQSVIRFPADNSEYAVYVVALNPVGYVVLNSDDRLPLIVAFSDSSKVNLDNLPDNAFRAALTSHVGQTPLVLSTLKAPDEAARSLLNTPGYSAQNTELYGPYLDTSWNQCNPYNLLCPSDPLGTEYYGYRVPTGCTPTAYAQVLYYHRWPLFGQGTHTYTDASGSITGQHTAVFSALFDWPSMQTAYDAFAASQAGDTQIADLMFRLGVVADANYESSGTSSSILTLGQGLNDHLFFETPVYRSSQPALLTPLKADLRAGFPAVVGIPGHAIVADGLLTDGTNDTYHINYGWGGSNNGWWSASGVPGGALSYGCTSLKPMLMAFPTNPAVTAAEGTPVELNWLIPKRREQESSRLVLRQLAQQSGSWSSTASGLSNTVPNGWSAISGGRTGNCWFAGPNGYASLTLTDEFVPDASASLNFYMKYKLGTATLSAAVSTNGGQTYTTCFTQSNNPTPSWQSYSVSLSAYAGQRVRVRFELSSGTYYSNGGAWLDDLSVTSGAWHRWVDFAQDTTLASRRFSDQRSVVDNCSDFSGFQVTSTSTYTDWSITTNGTERWFYKMPGGYSNHEYHLTSYSTVTPQANTRLLLRCKRNLATDRFRILVSLNRSSFTEIWSTSGQSDWKDETIPLGAYAGQPIYLRLQYVVGNYYSNGGVWIDSISLQEVQNPELEGQPVYYTVLTNVVAGSYTLASVLVDTQAQEHTLSPAFTLTVKSPFTYRTEANGSVTLTGYTSSVTRVTMPAQWNGKPVVGIASNAFASVAGLVSVTIPPSVTNIASGAFTGASGLRRVYFTGNAPTASGTTFSGTSATIYYTYGSTGWGATFANRPTALWNSTILGAQSLTTSGFRFTYNGPTNHLFVIEACDDLNIEQWTGVRTNVMLGITAEFTDATWTNAAARFYRIRTLEPQ
jgi:hypothetical protein